MTITAKDKWEAAVREIKQRERLYPHWVAKGRMKQEFADFQIGVMTAIAKDYETEAEAIIHAERTRQGSLL